MQFVLNIREHRTPPSFPQTLQEEERTESQGPLKAEKHLDKTGTLRGNKRGRVQSHSQWRTGGKGKRHQGQIANHSQEEGASFSHSSIPVDSTSNSKVFLNQII